MTMTEILREHEGETLTRDLIQKIAFKYLKERIAEERKNIY